MSPEPLPRPSATTIGLLGLGGIGIGVCTVIVVHRAPAMALAGSTLAGTVALLAAGWLATGVGLDAWRRRPGDLFGPLLAAAGALWFVTEWANPGSGVAVVFTVGLVLHAAFPPFVAHAALVHSAAPLHAGHVRAMLGVAYGASVLVAGFGPALFFDPVGEGCNSCPPNLLLVSGVPGVARFLERSGMAISLVALAVLAVVVGSRLVRTTPAARRTTAPVVAPAALVLMAAVAMLGGALQRGHPGAALGDRGLWWVQAISLAAVSLGVVGTRLRMRRARRRLAELVVELDSSPGTEGLAPALAAALGDPELVVAYRIGYGSFVDTHGSPVVPEAAPGRATTAVVRDGETIAVLVHAADLLGDPRLVEEVASAARLGLENDRLHAETRAQLAELRRSRLRIVEAGDAERRRLDRDLHDGAQQTLVAISLALRLLRIRLGDDADPAVTDRLAAAEIEMGAAVADLRRLARGVHPAVLSDYGLVAAVSALGEELPIRFESVGFSGQRLPSAVEAAAYQLVAEAAGTGPVAVTMTADDMHLRLDIAATRVPDRLLDLQDRVGALDGAIAVEPADDQVRLWAEIPCG